MIFRETLRRQDILNIFVDASITKVDDIYVSCPGLVAVTTNENNEDVILFSDKIILENSTNNNGEISAISLGIDYAISQKYNFKYINLFSDSKICIYGLREWIYKWIHNIKDDTMYGSSGTPVANQSEIICVVNKIIQNNLNICLYHQKGHVLNNQKSIYEAMKFFKLTNYFTSPLTYSDIVFISHYNNFVDNLTRETLTNYVLSNQNKEKVINFVYNQNIDMVKYAELTNRTLLKGRRF